MYEYIYHQAISATHLSPEPLTQSYGNLVNFLVTYSRRFWLMSLSPKPYVSLRTPTEGYPFGTYNRSIRDSSRVTGLRSKVRPNENPEPAETQVTQFWLMLLSVSLTAALCDHLKKLFLRVWHRLSAKKYRVHGLGLGLLLGNL